MRGGAGSRRCLIVSCEHGGCEVPPAYATLFGPAAPVLHSHRGFDAGALQLAGELAAALSAPLFAATTTRLLIDLNRSLGRPTLYSEFTRGLPRAQRLRIVERHYLPHRSAVEAAVAGCVAGGFHVVHIASHSFTPVLDGVVREVDVAWLYDPARRGETALARRWQALLAGRTRGLRLRRNQPYRGRSDGLTASLRKRFADTCYAGIELEVNQRFVLAGGAPWDALRAALVGTLAAVLPPEGG